eukprot:1691165-Pleurochrysis_carterae.AAC.4
MTATMQYRAGSKLRARCRPSSRNGPSINFVHLRSVRRMESCRYRTVLLGSGRICGRSRPQPNRGRCRIRRSSRKLVECSYDSLCSSDLLIRTPQSLPKLMNIKSSLPRQTAAHYLARCLQIIKFRGRIHHKWTR